jgi:DNA ligase-1
VASFYELAQLCETLSQTASRIQRVQLVADFLGAVALEEVEAAARFLAGRTVAQGDEARLKLSARAVWKTALDIAGEADVDESTFAGAADFGEAVEVLMRLRRAEMGLALTLTDVERAFEAIAAIEGRASRQAKLVALRELMARTSPLESKLLARIVIGEMRQGVGEGLIVEAIAKMASRPLAQVHRAFMLVGDVGRLARAAREGTLEAKTSTAPAAHPRPLRLMLAQTAADIAQAFALFNRPFALEYKLDGARVQIHRFDGEVKIFSRRLNEVTRSLPEIVALIQERVKDNGVIMDGEVIALGADGRPRSFQELMRRFRRLHDLERVLREQPTALFLFDLMASGGHLLIDEPYYSRWDALNNLAEDAGLALPRRIIPASVKEAEAFFEDALAEGYEGIMAKALDSIYTPGSRGGGWLKIKRAHTLDLVIVAADWGYGRRRGWLSNYHLAARGENPHELLEVGKTFKGPSDEEFQALTEQLLALKREERNGTVFVRPELVVEVAYSDIQRSPRYASGFTLRFARIVRVREDKSAAETDTVETIAQRFAQQASAILASHS